LGDPDRPIFRRPKLQRRDNLRAIACFAHTILSIKALRARRQRVYPKRLFMIRKAKAAWRGTGRAGRPAASGS